MLEWIVNALVLDPHCNILSLVTCGGLNLFSTPFKVNGKDSIDYGGDKDGEHHAEAREEDEKEKGATKVQAGWRGRSSRKAGGAKKAPAAADKGLFEGLAESATGAVASIFDGAPDLSKRGSLEVHVISAANLMAKDRGGTSDPYVLLELAGTKHRTKTIDKELNPSWDERFKFNGVLADLIAKPLHIKL